MNLQNLLERIKEIDTAIVNTTAQLNALQGHKAETSHWISMIQAPVRAEDVIPIDSSESPVIE